MCWGQSLASYPSGDTVLQMGEHSFPGPWEELIVDLPRGHTCVQACRGAHRQACQCAPVHGSPPEFTHHRFVEHLGCVGHHMGTTTLPRGLTI